MHDFEIQFEDPEFGNELCNLTDISELPPERAVLKIITKVSEELDDVTSMSSLDRARMLSSASSSSTTRPSCMALRQHENSQQWPSPFPIPTFSYDVELILTKGNEMFRDHGTLLTVPREIKMDILNAIAHAIFFLQGIPRQERAGVGGCCIS